MQFIVDNFQINECKLIKILARFCFLETLSFKPNFIFHAVSIYGSKIYKKYYSSYTPVFLAKYVLLEY